MHCNKLSETNSTNRVVTGHNTSKEGARGKREGIWYHEAFGADVFKIGSIELEVGTENWDNYRLYLSMYGRAVSGFGYDGR